LIALLDEMGNGSRGFPNNVLTELEDLFFRIPEHGDLRLHSNPELRGPCSNSERDLPDEFLKHFFSAYTHFQDSLI
jgi:hypothetical protein